MSQKKFSQYILEYGQKLNPESPVDLTKSIQLILIDAARKIILDTDHWKGSGQLSVKEAAISACFLSTCEAFITVNLQKDSEEIDLESIKVEVGFVIFRKYSIDDIAQILRYGGMNFIDMVEASQTDENFKEWLEAAQTFIKTYIVYKGDHNHLDLGKRLYRSLWNSRS
jgi:hypothetical protein